MASTPSRSEMEQYIRDAARARGIDPNTAVKVARSEGLGSTWQATYVKNGYQEPSYGPFQLLVGGAGTGFPTGLGNLFQKATGLNPANKSTWKQGVDFALDFAAKNGWGSWYGADKVGVGKWDGLQNAQPIGVSAPTTQIASLDNIPTPTAAPRETQMANAAPVAPVERGILASLFSQPTAQAAEQTSSYPAHAFDPEMGIPRDAPNFHVNMAPGDASNPLGFLTPVVNPMMPESIRTPGWWNTSAPSFPDMPTAGGLLSAPDPSRFATPRTPEEIAQAQSILGGLFSQSAASAAPSGPEWVSPPQETPSPSLFAMNDGTFASPLQGQTYSNPDVSYLTPTAPYSTPNLYESPGVMPMPSSAPAPAPTSAPSQADIMAAKTSESVTDAEYADSLRAAGLSETEIAMAVAARSAAAPIAPVAAPVAAPPLAAPKTVKQYSVAGAPAQSAPPTPAPAPLPSGMDYWTGKSPVGYDSAGGTLWGSGGETYRYSPLSDKVWQVGENGQGIPVYGDIPLPSQGSAGGINLPSKDRLMEGGKNILGKGAGGLLGSVLLGPVGGLLGAALGGKLANGGINGLLGGNKNTFPPAPNAYPARPVAPYGGGASSTYSQADIQRAYDLGGQAFGDAVAGGAQGLW